MIITFVFFFTGILPSWAQVTEMTKLSSPDGHTELEVGLNERQELVYSLKHKDRLITSWSRLGLVLDHTDIGRSVKLLGTSAHKHKERIVWPLGESKYLDNNYRELTQRYQTAGISFDMVYRCYNGAVAFRYIVHKAAGERTRVDREATEFNLADNYGIYQYHEESQFSKLRLNEMTNTCDLPATLVSSAPMYLSIGEADNRNYTKCVLLKGEKPNSLVMNFYIDTLYRNHQVSEIRKDTMVRFTGTFQTPWRTISCSESAVGLHDHSQLYLMLTEPENKTDAGQVRPGKVVRLDVNTNAGLEGISFAAAHNFSYVLFDAGWYGAEFRTSSDPTKPIDGFDIEKLTAYGRSKGIGVILYVNYVGLKSKLDTILPLYKKWGVAGLKFGFVDGGTQKGLSWLDTAMQKVNDSGFILNVHDHYKPTGLSRRYPYQLSQEGIRGDENSPDAFHTMVLPYTRFLAGAADFTFCYPNSKNIFAKNLRVSKGQQMALTVIYFSPMPSIFWYGKPRDYTDEKEIEFFTYVPTVWDESRYLTGEIGENIAVARKKDKIWYLGAACGLNAWSAYVPLNFLDRSKKYEATLYEDDGNKGVHIRQLMVTSETLLPVSLGAAEGQAAIFRPVK
ncbi:glycoside hydrolase family 97 catalytic domain-containing protein [Mucilaginibacter sp. AW1-3]